jgi:hypothetical protein
VGVILRTPPRAKERFFLQNTTNHTTHVFIRHVQTIFLVHFFTRVFNHARVFDRIRVTNIDMPSRKAHWTCVHYATGPVEDQPTELRDFGYFLDQLVGTPVTNQSVVNYVIYQLELCPTTQRKHYQFYIQVEKECEFAKVKAIFPESTHIDASKGSSNDNQLYCSKTESRIEDGGEHGDCRDIAAGKGQGSREDLKKLKEDIDGGMEWRAILDQHFGTVARHDRFIKDYIELKRQDLFIEKLKQDLMGCELRPWQQTVMEVVATVPDTRTVNWIWEAVGNVGKTWMSRYLAVTQDALILQSMKKADMIHLISKGISKVCIFDLSRTSELGAVNVVYEVIELLHNGYVCSGKYDSKSFRFAPPHVFVFANFAPDQATLSADRWKITNIGPVPNYPVFNNADVHA